MRLFFLHKILSPVISISALSLCVLGCNRSTDTTARYHEDGRAKPIAAVPTMIDTTSFEVPWSISEELTATIVQLISQKGTIYVQSRDDFAIAENPFSAQLAWMKKEFEDQEFAVFLELVEHNLVPAIKTAQSLQETSNNLNMSVRVRVIDLRGNEPKVVLQEMVRDSYYIPKTLFPTDYSVVSWGHPEYAKSPMSIAHMQLAREVASRVGDYILLAKSR
ncbi:MAG: hypothetical protein HY861_04485 [Chlamydiia bacterium]|nr:hypothetical protein [Chlamydiia bacterium]